MTITIPPAKPGRNAVELWASALTEARSRHTSEIRFSPGRYDFYPENCTMRYCYFSNNDEGIKTIALALTGMKDFAIRGENTELFFHGRISPLVAQECERLTVQGFSVDFEESFVSDADVVVREGSTAWLKIGGKHRFENGRLRFTEDVYDNLSGRLNFFEYDTDKKELVWNRGAIGIPNAGLQEKNGLIGVPGLAEKIQSDALIIKHELRLAPGLVFDRCCQVAVKDMKIYHAAGMGLLAQLCTDVQIENVEVSPSTRRVSVSDDAVHFSDCRGKLRLRNCRLSGTLDDAFNAHGIYRPLKMRIPGGKFYYLDTGHFQQQGVIGVFGGETLELIKPETGKPYASVKVRSSRLLNKALTFVEPEGEMPPDWVPGDNARVAEVAAADLEITGCFFSALNGRGVLASGCRSVLVRDNVFHTPGAGVFVSGDGGFWYESGPVRFMRIENNFFDNCCYRRTASTREPVSVYPELRKLEEGFFYHGDFSVCNNRFRSAPRPLVALLSVAKAELKDNSFEVSSLYPFDPPGPCGYSFAEADDPWAVFRHCGAVTEENNTGVDAIGKKENR